MIVENSAGNERVGVRRIEECSVAARDDETQASKYVLGS